MAAVVQRPTPRRKEALLQQAEDDAVLLMAMAPAMMAQAGVAASSCESALARLLHHDGPYFSFLASRCSPLYPYI